MESRFPLSAQAIGAVTLTSFVAASLSGCIYAKNDTTDLQVVYRDHYQVGVTVTHNGRSDLALPPGGGDDTIGYTLVDNRPDLDLGIARAWDGIAVDWAADMYDGPVYLVQENRLNPSLVTFTEDVADGVGSFDLTVFAGLDATSYNFSLVTYTVSSDFSNIEQIRGRQHPHRGVGWLSLLAAGGLAWWGTKQLDKDNDGFAYALFGVSGVGGLWGWGHILGGRTERVLYTNPY